MEEFMNRQEAVRRATELVEQMSVEELASQLRFDADEIPHLDIPEYNWWNEGLHGVARAGTATVFPQAIGLGATFDEELLERVGVAVSTEREPNIMKMKNMKTVIFIKELHFGRPMSISSGIPAGGVDMRLMEKTRH